VRDELRLLGLQPKHGLGQNFLTDAVHLQRIVDAAALERGDVVLEIGPGLGALTERLAGLAGRVVSVELDVRLITYLRARFATRGHVTIVQGDILKLAPGDFLASIASVSTGYKVVANLPYYITAAVLRHLVEAETPPTSMVLTVQSEVAERMVASPPNMSLLALGVQFFCVGEIADRIPAAAFYPVPKVDSAVVKLLRRADNAVPGVSPADFFRVARAGFCQPRKQLRNSLAAGLGVPASQAQAWLETAGISAQRRAETVTLDEWGALVRTVESK
jgi:16S rRNA (adenine1518-N6/adenine1519-N6)-dimethyltransferase